MTPLREQIENILDDLFETDAVYDMDSNAKRNLKLMYYKKFEEAIIELIDRAQPEEKHQLGGNGDPGNNIQSANYTGYNSGLVDYKSNLLKGVRGE